MTQEEKNEYLNLRIMMKSDSPYVGPKLLYKYRQFDNYTYDMVLNNYLFLCQAEKLDDPTECMTTLDLDRLMEVDTNHLKRECVDQIVKLLKPYTNQTNYEIAKSKIYSIMNNDGTVPANIMLDLSMELQNMVPEGVNIAPIVNYIVSIPEMLDKPEISSQLKPLINMAFYARKETGICSLAENNNDDYMWKNYSDNYSGYCIEYDVSNYEFNKELLPVIYQDERETNIIIQLVGAFIGQMITSISNGQIVADSSHFIRLFLTKYSEWSYQKEWRLIGKANEHIAAPNIKRIFIGKNADKVNKENMIDFANKNNIDIIEI